MSTVPLVCLKGVSKSYFTPGGEVRVLRDVNLALFEKEFAIVTGPSGSGKTTLLNLVSMLDIPTAGSVFFRERPVHLLTEQDRCELRKRHIGMVFQRFHLLRDRTALENVVFRFRYVLPSPPDVEQRAHKALEWVGLAHVEGTRARFLSAGEMQRVAIARAIVLPPDLLVADEPTGNLDRDAATAVMDCFERLHAELGMTILLVTHNEALLRFASAHYICRDGILERVR